MTLSSNVYDLLESSSLVRWGASAPLGSAVTVTYRFLPALPDSIPGNPDLSGFTLFSAAEQTATQSALNYISSFTNIKFVQTSDSDTNAEISFGNAALSGSGTAGITYYSYDSGGLSTADIFLQNTGSVAVAGSNFTPGRSITSNDLGGQGWSTLLHELGHALGLKHPFETNAANESASILPVYLDNTVETLMSYTPYNLARNMQGRLADVA